MKKTKNKWLLLFASLFVITTVACSNPSASTPADEPQTPPAPTDNPQNPTTPTTPAPTLIEDDTYVGIKINISDIPENAAVRNILINGQQVASASFSTDKDGKITVSKYVTMTEWGYPFVKAGETYKVEVLFQDKDYKTIQTSKPITITAKKGLGELYCPNQEFKIEHNILKFPKGTPLVYYGDSKKNIGDYPNIETNNIPSYSLLIYREDWRYQSWNWLGSGKDFEYKNDFDFAEHLEEHADFTKQYMFNLICSITDKTYGNYDYFIVSTSDYKFKIEGDNAIHKDSFNLSQYLASTDDFQGKVLLESNNYQYIEFAPAVDTKGNLSGKMYNYSNGKWEEEPISFKNGILNSGENSMTIMADGTGLYCGLAKGTRISGEGIYGTYQIDAGTSLTISSDGKYSFYGGQGTFTFKDGIISFQDGPAKEFFALYDGETVYLAVFYYMVIDELPNPLPDPTGAGTNVDENNEPYVRISVPTNNDLKGKILFYSTPSEGGPRDLYYVFGKDETNGILPVTMYPYNKAHTEHYGASEYAYDKGTLYYTSNPSKSYYSIFYANNTYYLSPITLERTSGKGLYGDFSITTSGSTLTISLNSEGNYTYSAGSESYSDKYTNSNGIITLKNEQMGDGYLLYDGEKLYAVNVLQEANSLPETTASGNSGNTGNESGDSGTSSGGGNNTADFSYLTGTYTATIELPDGNGSTETSNDTFIVDIAKSSFTWEKESNDSIMWFKGKVSIENISTAPDKVEYILRCQCTHEAESTTADGSPDWKTEEAAFLATFELNKITIYAYATITEGIESAMIELPNPYVFTKTED